MAVPVPRERERDSGEAGGADRVLPRLQQRFQQAALVERLLGAGLHAACLGQGASPRQLVDQHGVHARQPQFVGQCPAGRAGADDEHIGVHGFSPGSS